MSNPVDLFGSNSDGGVRMSEWLDTMCAGCKHESVRMRREGCGGGCGCPLVSKALCDPYTAEIPEWSPDATPYPPHCAEQFSDGNPWPVCLAYEPRKTRSDTGVRRGPRVPAGQGALL
jgi:hypothetical protein